VEKRNKRSPERTRLREQARQLQLLTTLQTGDAQVVQRADVPTVPFKPRRVRTLIGGLLIGLLVGLALAFLRDKLDRRLKNQDTLHELLPDVPVIGSIPRLGRGAKTRQLAEESFHNLQANVSFLTPDSRLRSVLITSAAPGEGKSTVTANLAIALAAHGGSPIVLEADLRRPALSNVLKLDREVGVSRILAGDGTVAASVKRTPVESSRNGDGPAIVLSGDLNVVPAGPTPPSPQILLNARRLESLLAEARAQSDTVLVDGPPLGVFSDMLPVAQRVDGVILAVRLYHSRTDGIKRFAEQLANAGIRPIGIVVLGERVQLPGYYDY
jgi:receptor protein-tyrosine kinase